MSPRPRRIVPWASLMLTALTSACDSPTAPLPPCTLELFMVDTGQCEAPVAIQAQEAAK